MITLKVPGEKGGGKVITGRPKKEPGEKVIRLSISFTPQAHRALSRIAQLTEMSKAQICSWAIVHLWKEIQEQGLEAEE